MSNATIWAVLGLLVCGAELIHPGVYLLWLGLAACGTGLVTVASGIQFDAQVIVFIVLVASLLAIPITIRKMAPPARNHANPSDAGLIGDTCGAESFNGNKGRVHVRDGTWQARLIDGENPADGTVLEIVGLEGTVLLVTLHRSEPKQLAKTKKKP